MRKLIALFLLVCGVKGIGRVSNHDDKKGGPLLKSGGLVRIGHLLPNNPAIAHEPEILRMCAADLKERKILPRNFTLQ